MGQIHEKLKISAPSEYIAPVEHIIKQKILFREERKMFIYSLHASTIRFLAVLCLALTALIALVVIVPTYSQGDSTQVGASVSYDYSGVKTASDRIAFIEQFGWKVDPEPVSAKEVRIPEEFDKVLSAYNELQRTQGLDLTHYKRKTVMRYTYTLTNYPSYDGTVYVNILVYRNTVIAGDVCSADVNGFIQGLERGGT